MIPLVALLAAWLGYAWGMRTLPTKCPCCGAQDDGISWPQAFYAGLPVGLLAAAFALALLLGVLR